MNRPPRSLPLLAILTLALLPACAGKPAATPEQKITLHIHVDGSDVIKIAQNKLWIEHEKFNVPDQGIEINGDFWQPDWKANTSSTYDQLNPPFKPTHPAKVKVVRTLGRGTVAVVSLPAAANDQTLSFRIDDNDFNGADWYEVEITW